MKPSWLIGYALNRCGVPCAEEIAMMLAKEADEPVVPESAMYLYGTPSTTGNIGLRSGDSVSYYAGAVLTDINTVYTDELKTQCPKAWIGKPNPMFNDNHYLCLSDDYDIHDNGEGWITSVCEDTNYRYDNGKWVEDGYENAKKPIWTNCDVRHLKNGVWQIAYSASDYEAIPVTDMVGYSFNGAVLSALPKRDEELFPLALVFREADGAYTVRFYTEAAHYVDVGTGNVSFGSTLGDKSPYLLSTYNGSGWSELTEVEFGARSINGNKSDEYTLLWANFTVEYDGTVYMEVTDPVPIYE